MKRTITIDLGVDVPDIPTVKSMSASEYADYVGAHSSGGITTT